nr:sugar-transfer associated ATP-grasp domain-containing protein [Halomonas socia]
MAVSAIKRLLKQAAQRVQRERCHAQHAKMARRLLVNLEQYNGALGSSIKRQARDYAHEMLGSAKYAPWLQVYSAVHGAFVEGWIPGDYYQLVVLPCKNGQVGQATNTKTLTKRLLNSTALPDIAYLIDGIGYAADYSVVRAPVLIDLLFAADERVFFKPDRSFQGQGIRILERSDISPETLARFPDGAFQRPVIQHGIFDALTPNATATLRLTTAKLPDGIVELRAADIRLGRARDRYVKAISEIRVPVELTTGALWSHGFMPDWRQVESHPDTGASFSNIRIPGFHQATAMCSRLHQGFPHLGCIGWDIAIDREESAKIMEWNARHNSIVFSEATTGPSFVGLNWETLWQRHTGSV